MAASRQIIPIAVPTQHAPTPRTISQEDLRHILDMRRQIESLGEQLKQAESTVRTALEAGVSAEPGVFQAFLKTTERRSVPWKQVCERELGEAYCARVLSATKPDTFTTLIIKA